VTMARNKKAVEDKAANRKLQLQRSKHANAEELNAFRLIEGISFLHVKNTALLYLTHV